MKGFPKQNAKGIKQIEIFKFMLCCCIYEFPAISGQAVASSRCQLETAAMAPHLFRKPHRIKTKEKHCINVSNKRNPRHLAKYPHYIYDVHFIKAIFSNTNAPSIKC